MVYFLFPQDNDVIFEYHPNFREYRCLKPVQISESFSQAMIYSIYAYLLLYGLPFNQALNTLINKQGKMQLLNELAGVMHFSCLTLGK